MKLLPVVRKKNGRWGKTTDPNSFEIVGWTYVDDKFFPELKRYRWFFSTNKYVCRAIRVNNKSRMLTMHHAVARMAWARVPARDIDHIDNNRLNNQIHNLRPSNRIGNARNRNRPKNNTSGFKGVHWDRGKFRAQIKMSDQHYNCGRHSTAKEAAMAYDKAAIELFGEFARTNRMLGLLD